MILVFCMTVAVVLVIGVQLYRCRHNADVYSYEEDDYSDRDSFDEEQGEAVEERESELNVTQDFRSVLTVSRKSCPHAIRTQ